MKHTILITGGIGAGKSVVSRILRLRGFNVYDTDLGARRIMNDNHELRNIIIDRWGAEAYDPPGQLNRPFVAGKIFADSKEREWLNGHVHRLVRKDIEHEVDSAESLLFVECAIPTTSFIDRMADTIWLVTASEEERLRRACARDCADREAVVARIRTQQREFDSLPEEKTAVIINDGTEPLLPQIDALLNPQNM